MKTHQHKVSIYIDGIAGSGKTTLAQLIARQMQDVGVVVHLIDDGGERPIDLKPAPLMCPMVLTITCAKK